MKLESVRQSSTTLAINCDHAVSPECTNNLSEQSSHLIEEPWRCEEKLLNCEENPSHCEEKPLNCEEKPSHCEEKPLNCEEKQSHCEEKPQHFPNNTPENAVFSNKQYSVEDVVYENRPQICFHSQKSCQESKYSLFTLRQEKDKESCHATVSESCTEVKKEVLPDREILGLNNSRSHNKTGSSNRCQFAKAGCDSRSLHSLRQYQPLLDRDIHPNLLIKRHGLSSLQPFTDSQILSDEARSQSPMSTAYRCPVQGKSGDQNAITPNGSSMSEIHVNVATQLAMNISDFTNNRVAVKNDEEGNNNFISSESFREFPDVALASSEIQLYKEQLRDDTQEDTIKGKSNIVQQIRQMFASGNRPDSKNQQNEDSKTENNLIPRILQNQVKPYRQWQRMATAIAAESKFIVSSDISGHGTFPLENKTHPPGERKESVGLTGNSKLSEEGDSYIISMKQVSEVPTSNVSDDLLKERLEDESQSGGGILDAKAETCHESNTASWLGINAESWPENRLQWGYEDILGIWHENIEEENLDVRTLDWRESSLCSWCNSSIGKWQQQNMENLSEHIPKNDNEDTRKSWPGFNEKSLSEHLRHQQDEVEPINCPAYHEDIEYEITRKDLSENIGKISSDTHGKIWQDGSTVIPSFPSLGTCKSGVETETDDNVNMEIESKMSSSSTTLCAASADDSDLASDLVTGRESSMTLTDVSWDTTSTGDMCYGASITSPSELSQDGACGPLTELCKTKFNRKSSLRTLYLSHLRRRKNIPEKFTNESSGAGDNFLQRNYFRCYRITHRDILDAVSGVSQVKGPQIMSSKSRDESADCSKLVVSLPKGPKLRTANRSKSRADRLNRVATRNNNSHEICVSNNCKENRTSTSRAHSRDSRFPCRSYSEDGKGSSGNVAQKCTRKDSRSLTTTRALPGDNLGLGAGRATSMGKRKASEHGRGYATAPSFETINASLVDSQGKQSQRASRGDLHVHWSESVLVNIEKQSSAVCQEAFLSRNVALRRDRPLHCLPYCSCRPTRDRICGSYRTTSLRNRRADSPSSSHPPFKL